MLHATCHMPHSPSLSAFTAFAIQPPSPASPPSPLRSPPLRSLTNLFLSNSLLFFQKKRKKEKSPHKPRRHACNLSNHNGRMHWCTHACMYVFLFYFPCIYRRGGLAWRGPWVRDGEIRQTEQKRKKQILWRERENSRKIKRRRRAGKRKRRKGKDQRVQICTTVSSS